MSGCIPEPDERAELESLIADTRSAAQLRRARALVRPGDGLSAAEVAELLRVSRQTVYNRAARFRMRAGSPLPDRLADAPRSGRPPTALNVIDPLIAAVADGDPRESGYAATIWTVSLLREHLRRVHGIEACDRSVAAAVSRLRLRWRRPRHRLALRPDARRQAKGGSSGGCGNGTGPSC